VNQLMTGQLERTPKGLEVGGVGKGLLQVGELLGWRALQPALGKWRGLQGAGGGMTRDQFGEVGQSV
jgi:hypothetical protein